MTRRLYTYYPEFDNESNLLWLVFEESTSQVVADFWFEDDAEEFCNFLESGGGFAGSTPSFMIKKVPTKTDINEAFAAEFT